MNTAMSTKRSFIASHQESKPMSGAGISVLGLIVGLALMVLGTMLESAPPAAVGFVAFMTSLLYLNTMFWAKFYADKKISMSQIRNNRYF